MPNLIIRWNTLIDENHVHVGEEMIVSISSNKKVIQKNLLLKGANELQIRESPNFTKFLSLAIYKEMKILKKKTLLELRKIILSQRHDETGHERVSSK